MIGAYIAITALVVVWGYILYKINKNTSWRKLYKSLRLSKKDVERQEKVHYRKKGWTDRLE
ncbi:hypothetical protein M199_gp155 [Halogranum tailed virus 1]|uniref:Uncharacterized protein n=1 Tax=Halogranum tailed virus 1 TaxID=1273749 RepID=R4TGW1_9CAUD|nr:hypothetical protein M199_gp155 [Halogranum tailed virus 1]AGM11511.1 hypothetical protein HGTV1_214 [Halogranum tailed virus 1]